MIDFEKQLQQPAYGEDAKRQLLAKTFRLVYGWMSAGLTLSGLVAWFTATSGLWQKILVGHYFLICIVAELALVWGLGAAINKLSPFLASAMFILYAAVNGLTLSVVFIAYELASVERIFFITAAMFGGLAFWGTITREDLSRLGAICGMAVWGLLISLVANIFIKSSGFDWLISIIGVLTFTGLTIYDAQKIKHLADANSALDRASAYKLGILGALSLYLDFVNLFLYLLRLFGDRRK